jgi:hypothetical protein
MSNLLLTSTMTSTSFTFFSFRSLLSLLMIHFIGNRSLLSFLPQSSSSPSILHHSLTLYSLLHLSFLLSFFSVYLSLSLFPLSLLLSLYVIPLVIFVTSLHLQLNSDFPPQRLPLRTQLIPFFLLPLISFLLLLPLLPHYFPVFSSEMISLLASLRQVNQFPCCQQ